MFTLPSLLPGALSILFCLLCSPYPALAQTQSFPELPPPAAYPDGVFFSPNTSTATAQVLKAGETLTIRWGTNFENVDLQLVAGEYWDSPLELAAAIEDKEFNWVVDSYGNNSLPFSIVARDALGSERERLEGGFVTGQFWIARGGKDDDDVAEAEEVAGSGTASSSPNETQTRRVEATRTVMVTRTTARPTSTSAAGEDQEDEEENENESMSQQMLSSSTVTQESRSQTTATGAASSTVNRIAAAASSSSILDPEETTATVSAGILLPSVTSSAHDPNATSETLLDDNDDDGKHSISTASLSSTSIAAIGLGAGLGLIVLVLVVVFVVAVWFRGRKRKGAELEYRKGDDSGCDCGSGREACHDRGRGTHGGMEERSFARASPSPSPSPLRAREGQV